MHRDAVQHPTVCRTEPNPPSGQKNHPVPMSVGPRVTSLELKQWAQEAYGRIFQSHLTFGRWPQLFELLSPNFQSRAHSQGTGRVGAVQVKSSAQLLAQRCKHVKIITLIIVIIFILLKIIGGNFKIRLNSVFISCFWGGVPSWLSGGTFNSLSQGCEFKSQVGCRDYLKVKS